MSTEFVDGRGLDDLRLFAVSLAQSADVILAEHRNRPMDSRRKPDGTPQTVADVAIEQHLRKAILERYPRDAVRGEEFPDAPGESGWSWYIDPIDGTRAYTCDVPLYSTLIGVEFEGTMRIGVAHFPGLGETISAMKDGGCFHGDSLCRVREQAPVDGIYVMTSEMRSWPRAAVVDLLDSEANVRTWGDAYGYLLLATGRVDAMVDCDAKAFDLAAVSLIVTEAGGYFTNLEGTSSISTGAAIGAATKELAESLSTILIG